MSWSKLDDSLSDHPKAIAAGPALALWTRALAWCARHHTDGHVPEQVATSFATCLASDPLSAGCPAGHIARLVDVGLWEAEDGGYHVHDYCHFHESRASWLERTAAERDRKRRDRGMSARTDDGQTKDGGRTAGGPPARARPSPSPSPSPKTDQDPSSSRAIPVPPDTDTPPSPGLAAALVALFPDLAPDVDGLLSEWQATFPGLDYVQLAREARTRARAGGRRVERAASLLTGWYSRAWAERRAAPVLAEHVDDHAKRKRAELAERRLAKQLDGPADAKPIGADIGRLLAAVGKGGAT
jgi:hypothetical protein